VVQEYEAPKLRELGSLEELTEQQFNKVGQTPDGFVTNPNIVGSVVPVP
jgi:hypothetical protein